MVHATKSFISNLSLRNSLVIALGILCVAIGWKIFLLIFNVFPFNADEAIVALMGKHILAGERPVFFYGQAYMGSLDGFLVALGFSVFGIQVWVIRLIQILLYSGTILTTIMIGKEAFRSTHTGLLAALLMAVPTVNVTLYTTVSLGGYGEALLIGNLILLVGFGIINRLTESEQGELSIKELMGRLFLWFLICGIGLWANGLTLIYTFPMGLAILVRLWDHLKKWGWWKSVGLLGCGLLGFFIGSAPWWIFAIQNGLNALISELAGAAVSVETVSWIGKVGNHLINLILLGVPVTLGFRPPWDASWLVLAMIPFVMVIWAGIVVFMVKNLFNRLSNITISYRVMCGIILTLSGGFVLTSFGVDPSGRYFVPLALPLSLVAAEFVLKVINRRVLQIIIVCLLLGYCGWGTLEMAGNNPPGITTQFSNETRVDQSYLEELSDFLKAEGETRGYTNYWVAYPLAFISDEELIFVPRLPYHADFRYTPRDNRYPPYNDVVNQSSQIAYITSLTPELDERLREGFSKLGVQWEEREIGDYVVFYHLSQKVDPEEIMDFNP
jgi:4-amino-4-deoxy-L-arabinose transferase-like glycosyltransferase